MKKRLIFGTCALLVLFGLMRDYTQDEVASTSLKDASVASSEYDYYINGMTLDKFSIDGQHAYRIKSERVTHFPLGDLSLMSFPAFYWFDPLQPVWEMTASSGILSPDPAKSGKSLRLKTDVLANRLSADDVLSIETDSLNVYPNAKEISTEAFVTVNNSRLQLSGTGLHALLAENKITLLSEVRGQHE